MNVHLGILDYGVNNIGSLVACMQRLGFRYTVLEEPPTYDQFSHVILPGVGQFSAGMNALQTRGFADYLVQVKSKGKPILGICLGLQLLARGSEEGGDFDGLGFFPGIVKRINVESTKLRLPHIGWNTLTIHQPNTRLSRGLSASAHFYFVHSYSYVSDHGDDVLASTHHGETISAIVRNERVYGTQFHPEKSQDAGEHLLRNFVEAC